MELLRVILKRAAEEHGVAQRLIASADDLESLAAGRETQILNGWRYKVFGSDAEKLIQGKLGLAVENKRVRIFPLDTA